MLYAIQRETYILYSHQWTNQKARSRRQQLKSRWKRRRGRGALFTSQARFRHPVRSSHIYVCTYIAHIHRQEQLFAFPALIHCRRYGRGGVAAMHFRCSRKLHVLPHGSWQWQLWKISGQWYIYLAWKCLKLDVPGVHVMKHNQMGCTRMLDIVMISDERHRNP